ncbi:TPA: hypothetical protein U1B40_002014 [Streptococcus suis]|uniref:hypothetical protein n=1 Tax=Streptococcus suis TaxID=1307 RepID=UPI00196046E2|nr:hypothetical protein [Streptococcus suis]MBM7137029.1 hypothetical protein [Streptococcus suis]MBY4601143.1 hypothetical protein [Streptococcus suis]MCO8172445.1 hypothetical protein [Streptococcus suis]MCO8180828.1 hypothetical protein [Streptococcus suis]MCO8190960.1 hypothetical protein [Streptococcus suis]
MAKKNKKITKELTPLEKYGTTVVFLRLLGWINVPFVLFFGFLSYMGEFGESTNILTSVFGIFTIITIVCLVLSYLKKFVKHFQEVVYLLISIESFISMFLFDFMGFLTIFDDHSNLTYSDILPYILPLFLLFIVSLIFFYFYHKNESVYKLNNYFNNGKASKGAVSVPIIFTGVMASRMFFEGNASFGKIMGIIVAVMLTATFPAAIMGGLFSAAYIRKYPDRKEIQ